jgi:hypothetical protein
MKEKPISSIQSKKIKITAMKITSMMQTITVKLKISL